ncbi:MAG: GMC family oxidoreductase [Gammaproteobacteria bacterium]
MTTNTTAAGTFDYVVVGAGSAGCILARRLADSGASVCVIESGPADRSPFIHVPAGFLRTLLDPALTWRYKAEGSEWTGGRRIPAVHGRLLGGSSAVNGMVWVRGQAADYDDWAAAGNPGWSFAQVLPYFERAEAQLQVSDADWHHPLCDALIRAARESVPAGQAAPDAGYYRRNIHRGRRMSAARAYLRPLRQRPSLDLRCHAHAVGVRFDGRRAVAVRYVRDDARATVLEIAARREILLCAGALATPRLLQLSGVGAPALLADLGINVVHALPGVGEHLRDHHTARIIARARGVATINELARFPRSILQGMQWLVGQPSLVGVSAAIAYAFLRSAPDVERPDLALIFTPGSYKGGVLGLLDDFPGMTLGAWPLRPASSGFVRARTADPFALPQVQPNYLADEADRRVLLAGLRRARALLAAPAFERWVEREETPGPACAGDEALLEHARGTGTTCNHFAGSCRMGPTADPTTVVDAALRVHGIDGLRIADASVMPMITSGNTNAPTMMIAEKAADLILGR